MKKNDSTLKQKATDEKKIKQLYDDIKQLDLKIKYMDYGLKRAEMQSIIRAKLMKIEGLKTSKDISNNKYFRCKSFDNLNR